MSALNVALPSMGHEFAMEAVLMGWVASAAVVASAVFLVPCGRLADIFGRKRIFQYGAYVNFASCFLCAIANSSALVLLFRIFQGVSAAMMIGTSIAILTSAFPAQERGKAFGVNTAAVYLGHSVGPSLGGILTHYFGWRSIFFLSTVLSLAIIVLVLWKLKGEWAESRGEKFDFVGSVAFSVSLLMVLGGFTILPGIKGIVLIVLGALAMVVFVRWEARVESPLLKVGLLWKNKAFVFSNLATLINYVSVFAVLFLVSLYLQYTKGLSPQAAGFILLAQPVVMAICSPFTGRLSDRVEPQIVASAGLAFSCVALILFAFLTEESSLGLVIGSLAVLGFGMGVFVSPNTSAVMGSVDRRFFGVAAGTQATTRSAGMSLSMAIVMVLFSIYIGEAQITPEYYPAFLASTKVGFIIFTVICFGGIFTQLAGRQTRRA